MIKFYFGYALTVYAFFVAFVLWILPPHIAPEKFSAMFFIVLPLCYIAMGCESFIHIHSAQKKEKEIQEKKFIYVFCDGVITGLLSIVLLSITFWLCQYSLWFICLILVIAFLLPGMIFILTTHKQNTSSSGADKQNCKPNQ